MTSDMKVSESDVIKQQPKIRVIQMMDGNTIIGAVYEPDEEDLRQHLAVVSVPFKLIYEYEKNAVYFAPYQLASDDEYYSFQKSHFVNVSNPSQSMLSQYAKMLEPDMPDKTS